MNTDDEDFYTSDAHLGHLIAARDRGFSTTDEHDEWFIDLWRSVVKPTSRVFVLGDLTSGGREVTDRALEIIDSLPGEKHFIAGNHDECHPANRRALGAQRRWLKVFSTVNPFLLMSTMIEDRRRGIALSHFPYSGDHVGDHDRFEDWRLRPSERWLLHGHTHSTRDKVHDGNQLHIGLDSWRSLVPMSTIKRLISISEASRGE